jgi:hypothetical protein
MDFMNVLSLAIGMVTVYLVFALSVTAFNEAIAATLSSRGKWLLHGVASLFSRSASDKGDMAMALKAYDSPYIAYLQRGTHYLPSYLPAWNLLQGMLDAASTGGARTLATLDDLRAATKNLPDGSPIRIGLENLLAAGDLTVEDFRQRYEAWFATFEAQVMSWYRQKTQLVVAGLSLVVVMSMNVDTLALVNQLAADPKVREALAEQGGQWSTSADLAAAAAALPAASKPGVMGVAETLQPRASALATSGIRLGWTQRAWDRAVNSPFAAFEKLVGLMLSAFAVALGAPFWFDLLKNLVAIRSVGKSLSEQTEARDKKAKAEGD